MNIQEIRSRARWMSHSDERTFPDDKFAEGFFMARRDIITKLLASIPEWGLQGELLYTDLFPYNVAEGQAGHNGEYPMPIDALSITSVDISYNGTDFNKAKMYFANDIEESEESKAEMNSVATTENPAILMYRGNYFVRPLAEELVIGGLKMKATIDIKEIEDDAEIPDILPIFHEVYIYAMAVYFGTRYSRKMRQSWIDKYEEKLLDVQLYYQNRWKRNLQLKATGKNDYDI